MATPVASRLPHAHLVQLDIAWEDPATNHEQVRQLLDKADVRPGDFVLLPEMFDTAFSFNIPATNDKRGRTLQFLLDLADDLQATVQGGRTVAACHRCAARNVATICAPGQKLLAEYAKMHLFSPGGEQQHFEPGREVATFLWDARDPGAIPGLRVQPAICYDLRFPELFRAGLAAGAEAIALGACWLSTRHAHWKPLLIARAIENQSFVLAVNRVGKDPDRTAPGPDGAPTAKPGARYLGGSVAISPKGEVLDELGDQQGVLSVAIDPASVRSWREQFSAWRDRVAW
jgi:predicted amidohydrolase